MSAKTIQEMADNIKRNLSNHGFPEKSVALPLERLYEAAHRDGLNFNKVLEHLESLGILNEKTAEKIIFRPKPAQTASSPFSGLNLDALKNMDFSKMNMGDMMKQAQEMMKNMSPDQLLELKKMYEGMTPEERAEILKAAKNHL